MASPSLPPYEYEEVQYAKGILLSLTLHQDGGAFLCPVCQECVKYQVPDTRFLTQLKSTVSILWDWQILREGGFS